MATFVLVHGLGLGGWCWRRVTKRLRQAGHEVFTPTLTGVGERSHLASSETNLTTHILDVRYLMQWERLTNVTLVGHSYGGAVVTGAADAEAARIKRLIYLDAFVLRNGESIRSLQPEDRIEHYDNLVAQTGDGWLVPPNPAKYYGLKDIDQQRWVDESSVAQPYATLTQPIELTHDGVPAFARSYVWFSAFSPSPFVQFAKQFRTDPNWSYEELEVGHMAMISHPNEIAELLCECVS